MALMGSEMCYEEQERQKEATPCEMQQGRPSDGNEAEVASVDSATKAVLANCNARR